MIRDKYDANLQMFVQTPRELDLKRLIFFRRLAEKGKLEHKVEGLPVGDEAARALLTYMTPIEAIVREGIPGQPGTLPLLKVPENQAA
jgi:hypothetical protein